MSAEGWFKKMKSERIRLIDRNRAIERFAEAIPAKVRDSGQSIPVGVMNSLIYQSRCLTETLDRQIDEMAEAERRGIILRANPDKPIWCPLEVVEQPSEDEDIEGLADDPLRV